MARIRLSRMDNKAVIKTITQQKERISKEVNAEITATLYDIRNQARANTPVNTGYLRNSIHVVEQEGAVVVRADYAPFVEFGTGTSVQVPAGLEEYALQFKRPNENDVSLPARPFLIPAWHERTTKLINRLRRVLK